MINSSEWVSVGHPDRLSDNLASHLIQDVIKKDGMAGHAAVEVFLTHNKVIFSGEVTTTLDIDESYLSRVVEKEYSRAGYIPQMREFWSKDEVVLANDVKIISEIQKQSPDIALGTTDKLEETGFNDQGVYFSSSERSNEARLGMPMLLATMIGEHLHNLSRKTILYDGFPVILGPDVKVVVSLALRDDNYTPLSLNAITIAQSHASSSDIEEVRKFIKSEVTKVASEFCQKYGVPSVMQDSDWVINGTGRFVIHGQVSDTSMTGRKISVNHPSAGAVFCSKLIGGGSLVKPYNHASDFLLNIMARFVANVIVKAGVCNYAAVGCAGAIGQKGLQSLFIYGDKEATTPKMNSLLYEFFSSSYDWSPYGLYKLFHLDDSTFMFSQAVFDNFFGHPESQPWEDHSLIYKEATKLQRYLERNYKG